MSSFLVALGKKTAGLALIFNSLLSIVSSLRILQGFYAAMPWWKPFYPFLLDGTFFWAVIPASILNLIPAKIIGNVRLKRVIFHHYVYGFFVLSITIASTWLFTLISIFHLLTEAPKSSLACLLPYIQAFFIYGGIALVLDDICDVSPKIELLLKELASLTKRFRIPLHLFHALCSLISIYVSLSIGAWFYINLSSAGWSSLEASSYIVLTGSILVTGLLGLSVSLRRGSGNS